MQHFSLVFWALWWLCGSLLLLQPNSFRSLFLEGQSLLQMGTQRNSVIPRVYFERRFES